MTITIEQKCTGSSQVPPSATSAAQAEGKKGVFGSTPGKESSEEVIVLSNTTPSPKNIAADLPSSISISGGEMNKKMKKSSSLRSSTSDGARTILGLGGSASGGSGNESGSYERRISDPKAAAKDRKEKKNKRPAPLPQKNYTKNTRGQQHRAISPTAQEENADLGLHDSSDDDEDQHDEENAQQMSDLGEQTTPKSNASQEVKKLGVGQQPGITTQMKVSPTEPSEELQQLALGLI